MLSQKSLQEFKEIWKLEFGEDISDDFAMAQAVNLITLLNTVYKPITRDDYEKMETKFGIN